MTDTFPRQQARTLNFSLGVPRSFQVSADGKRIAFLRSKDGSDPMTCLWALDLPADGREQVSDAERLVVDPALIGARTEEPEEERARRERSREKAGGVVAFATDAQFTMAAFALAGEVHTVSLAPDGPGPRRAAAQSPAIDPRPDPGGQRVAYVCDSALRITNLRSGEDAELIGPGSRDPGGAGGSAGAEPGDITFGLAEFAAAEEMDRMRGYWWAPDGSALLVARVDNSGVNRWHIADPANPGRQPVQVRYPAAGTPNAVVSLFLVSLAGSAIPVAWDAGAFPYLTTVSWDSGDPLIVVQSRDQRAMQLLAVDRATGRTTVLRADSDACWLDIVPGVPARMADGRIAWTADVDGARGLLVATEHQLADRGAAPVTPAGLHVRAILSVDGDTVLLSASDEEPTEIGIWSYGPDGLRKLSGDSTVRADGSGRPDATVTTVGLRGAALHRGVHGAVRAGGTTVLTSRSMAGYGLTTTVLRDAADHGAVATIGSLAQSPSLPRLRVELVRAGRREIRAAVILPSWHQPGSARLPVLMDPYGGPHAQRVLASADAYLTSQWFADQGFAVVVADGRGTPGRGPAWERAVTGDLAGPVLEDQVDALTAVAELNPDLDLSRVAIRGWSFGGYLSALAVLRRPDVFHAAIAGAPVTDWQLYDTHYTERYLGHPAHDAAAYEQSSLLADAHRLSRPLMIIHGLADDNVVVAHSLRLSCALLAAGRPHQVLPLSGVTHMAAQEEVAENILLLQVDFLRSALGLAQEATGQVSAV
ncbi:MAG TPA: prolyl oligopeptidase family serine peptidase [Streptosporangiaceae bacterium]|nr:prolyl oligopeptidase family serine peptidase [Streptosporangiaceae bacterium]